MEFGRSFFANRENTCFFVQRISAEVPELRFPTCSEDTSRRRFEKILVLPQREQKTGRTKERKKGKETQGSKEREEKM